MGRPRVQHVCRDCGKPVGRRGRYLGGYRCIDCAIEASVELQRQFRDQQGEYYEKWANNLADALEERRKRIAAQHAAADAAPPE